MVKTYSPTVVTSHENSTIKMNGKNVGKLSASGDYYQKKLDPVIAGRYTFSVSANLSGKTISPSPVKLDLFSNHQVSLNITTGSFTVSSVPNGEVYINDKKVADLDDKGPAGSGKTYANYTVTHNLSYTGDKDDTYQNRIISQDSDGDYVLEKLGTPNAK